MFTNVRQMLFACGHGKETIHYAHTHEPFEIPYQMSFKLCIKSPKEVFILITPQ